MAQALRTNSTLRTLDLRENPLSGSGVAALADAVTTRNSTLTSRAARSTFPRREGQSARKERGQPISAEMAVRRVTKGRLFNSWRGAFWKDRAAPLGRRGKLAPNAPAPAARPRISRCMGQVALSGPARGACLGLRRRLNERGERRRGAPAEHGTARALAPRRVGPALVGLHDAPKHRKRLQNYPRRNRVNNASRSAGTLHTTPRQSAPKPAWASIPLVL